MVDFLRLPHTRVPGLITDEALQETLKQFTDEQNGALKAAPPPSSALEMADRIQRDWLRGPQPGVSSPFVPRQPTVDQLLRAAAPRALDARERAVDYRSDVMANEFLPAVGDALSANPMLNALGVALGVVRDAVTRTPEQPAEEMKQRADAARRAEAAAAEQIDLAKREREAGRGLFPLTDMLLEQRVALVQQRAAEATAARQQAERDQFDPMKQVKYAGWYSNALEFGREVVKAPILAVEGVAAAYEVLAPSYLGGRPAAEIVTAMRTLDATIDKILPPDGGRTADFATKLSAGAGSMVGFMMGGMAARAIGASAGVATGALGATAGGAAQLRDADLHDATALQRLLAFYSGAALGATEALPIDRMLRRVDQATGGLVQDMLVNATAGSLEEFLQELTQSVGADIIAKATYDPTREVDIGEALENAAVGAITGGVGAVSLTALGYAGVLPADTSSVPPQLPEAQQAQVVDSFLDMSQADFDARFAGVEGFTDDGAGVLPEIVVEADGDVAAEDAARIQRVADSIAAMVPGAEAEIAGVPASVEQAEEVPSWAPPSTEAYSERLTAQAASIAEEAKAAADEAYKARLTGLAQRLEAESAAEAAAAAAAAQREQEAIDAGNVTSGQRLTALAEQLRAAALEAGNAAGGERLAGMAQQFFADALEAGNDASGQRLTALAEQMQAFALEAGNAAWGERLAALAQGFADEARVRSAEATRQRLTGLAEQLEAAAAAAEAESAARIREAAKRLERVGRGKDGGAWAVRSVGSQLELEAQAARSPEARNTINELAQQFKDVAKEITAPDMAAAERMTALARSIIGAQSDTTVPDTTPGERLTAFAERLREEAKTEPDTAYGQRLTALADSLTAPPDMTPEQAYAARLTAVAASLKERYEREGGFDTDVAREFVEALSRPPVFSTKTIQASGGGGTVPAPTNDDGTITLHHWAPAPRDELDPEKFGTGPLRGEERKRLSPGASDFAPRTYYGMPHVTRTITREEYLQFTPEEQAAADLLPERVREHVAAALRSRYGDEAQRRPYQKEPLGNWRHDVSVDPNKLYNFYEDAQNLKANMPEGLRPLEQVSWLERAIYDAGFDGIYFDQSPLGQVVLLFRKATPTAVVDTTPATPGNFGADVAASLNRDGWAVITGTQEAQGNWDSPENVANNERLRQRLEEEGIPFQLVAGSYQGVDQGPNYLIFTDEAKAVELGREFAQESILTRKGLVYQDGSVTPAIPSKNVVGDAAKELDFFSTLEDGQTFSVALDFDQRIPAPPDGVRAQTASSRGAFKGEQKRAGSGTQGAPDASAGDIRLSKIAQNFIKLLNLTVRQGRLTAKGSAGTTVAGQFSDRSGVVRLRTWNDLSTLVHEGAHAMQRNAGPALLKFINDNKARLTTAATKLYGGDVSNMKADDVVAEGFAEFFRVYVLNRAFAAKNYATLTQEFDLLMDTMPDIRDGLAMVGQQFEAWLQLPSATLVRNMVVSGKEPTGIAAAVEELQEHGFNDWFRTVARNTIAATTNRHASLNKLVTDMLESGQEQLGAPIDLKRAEDPRTLIRLLRNVGARAHVQTTDGVMPYKSTTPATRSLRDALLRYHGLAPDARLSKIDTVREQDFNAYLVALRGIDEYRRLAAGEIERPPVKASLGDLRVTVREMDAKYGDDFKEAAKIVHEYGMGLWQKAFDAGLIDKKTYAGGLNRLFYAPLQRDMSDMDTMTASTEASRARQGASIVKRFRGSDRDIIYPMDALMKKTYDLERAIAENDVKLALARLADRAGTAGAFVERVPARQFVGAEYTVQEVARQLAKDDTLDPAEAQDLLNLLDEAIGDGNRIALFRSQQALTKGENILFFWEGGKLAAIQLKDGDIGADVINVMNGLGNENMPVWLETVAMTSTAFRTLITSWPDFLVANFIRDQMSAWILTDVGYKPFATGIRGVADEVRQREWARMYNAAMGTMGGMNVATLHKARVERDINALRSRGYFARAFNEGGVLGAIKGFGKLVETSETGTRIGIFRKAYERAKLDNLTDWEAAIEAAYTATDYMDFGLQGNQMLMARRLVPFLNAQLQGLYKMMRTLGADEVRQRKGLMFALRAYFKDINRLPLSRTEKQALQTGRKAWIKMASLGFISAALHFLFQDNPDYEDASEYLRTTGWVIPLGDGRLWYIPKPFELAIVANFTERALEHASGDESAKGRFLRGVAMNLTPPASPPAIQLIVEQMANFDFFSGREIVPDYMRALAPELQYTHYTSSLAKQIGSITGWSPLRVDHFLSGIGASAYRDLTLALNAADPNRPSMDATDAPFLRRFIRDARRGSTTQADFWAQASTVDGELRRAEVSYKQLIAEGREKAAEEFLQTLDPDMRAYAILNTHFKADAKRLHPFYRTRQVLTAISALRRELVGPLGVETQFGDALKLSSREKADVDRVLSEIGRREMRNTLVFMDRPGWSGKAPLRVDSSFSLLEEVSPEIHDELLARLRRNKVYNVEVVQDYWPDVRDRVNTDGPDAFLKDVIGIAKVM